VSAVRSSAASAVAGVALIAVLMAAAGGPAAAGEATVAAPAPAQPTAIGAPSPSPAISLDQAAYTSLDGLKTAVSVDVRNETSSKTFKDLKLIPTLHGLLRADGKPATVDSADVVGVTPPRGPVGPGQTGTFVIGLKPKGLVNDVQPGTYSGTVAAVASGAPLVARATFTVTFPGNGATTAVPISAKQTVQAVRWIPFWDRTVQIRGSWIPLKPPIAKSVAPIDLGLKAGQVLGAVAGDKGGVASVRYVGDTKTLPARVAGIQIAASGFDGPGTYAGALQLSPGEAGKTELTIITKDAIIWPALAIVLGIWAALWARRWRLVGRRVQIWRRRLSTARARFTAAQTDFQAKATGTRWADYNASAAFRTDASKTGRLIDRIDDDSFDAIAKGREKPVQTGLERLERARRAMTQLDHRARALEGALAALPATNRPAFAATADSLVVGKDVTLNGLTTTLSEMGDGAEAARSWPSWSRQVAEAIEQLKQVPDDSKHKPKAARALAELTKAWNKMRSSTDLGLVRRADALKHALARAAAVLEDVHGSVLPQVAPALSHLAPTLSAGKGAISAMLTDILPQVNVSRRARLIAVAVAVAVILAAAVLGLIGTAVPQVVGILCATALAVAATPAALRALRRATLRGLAWLSDRIGLFSTDELRRGDAWMTLLAWLVALGTGLAALYYTKTFGTPTDYLTATLWGFTATTALDAVAQALRARREPVSGDGAGAGGAPAS
jgi:hypothetical protein